MDSLSPQDVAKRAAAIRAADYIEDGMRVGLGTGSTAEFLVREIARKVAEGMDVVCVATSRRTFQLAAELGVPVASLAEARWLDITIDGADEIDDELTLIKGGGGALLQEKIVATASDRMVVIADASKEVAKLGAFPLPIEVIGFGAHSTRALVEEILEGLDVMGRQTSWRMAGEELFETDEGNRILDLHLKRIGDVRQLALVLNQVPGVVENGLFIDIADEVVIGHPSGRVEIRDVDSLETRVGRVETPDRDNAFLDM